MSKFTDLIADLNAQKNYLIELNPYESGSETTKYVSDNGFKTEPGDSPANQYYDPRIIEAFQFKQSIFEGSRLRGVGKSDFGAIVLASGVIGTDNATLDSWVDFGWDGRDVTIKLGGPDFSLSEYGTIFVGKTDKASLTESQLTITLGDFRRSLDIEIQENEYAGTGGTEGGSDLEGKAKPLCYGKVRNITPVYLGVIGGNHTYQVHDGEINGVPVVRSNGAQLTEVGSAPSAGEYAVDEANGTFELGGSTLDTLITCDVEGAAPSSTWKQTAADIIEHIITDKTDFTSGDFETNTVSDLNTTNNALVGIWVPEGGNLLEVISQILNAIGAYLITTRAGEIRLGRIEEPKVTADHEFVGDVDSTDVEKDQILDIKRLTTKEPLSAVRLNYKRNYTPMDTDKIAGAVSEADRTFLQNEWRKVSDSDGTIKTVHPLAQPETFESLIDDKTAASTEATRLLDLFKEDRSAFEITLKAQPLNINLGETVKITDRRFNLESGKNFVVVALSGSASRGQTVLTLYG